jgi:hypothetical protein
VLNDGRTVLLDTHEEKLATFYKCVLKLRRQHEYLLGQVGNAVQTLVFFDVLESMTVTLLARRWWRLEQ